MTVRNNPEFMNNFISKLVEGAPEHVKKEHPSTPKI